MKKLKQYLNLKNIPFNILPFGIQLNRIYIDFELHEFCYKNKIFFSEFDTTYLYYN